MTTSLEKAYGWMEERVKWRYNQQNLNVRNSTHQVTSTNKQHRGKTSEGELLCNSETPEMCQSEATTGL